MNLSPHFTLEELTASANAARLGIDNMPTPYALEHLKTLCVAMEQVRTLLGDRPIHVTSGYRSDELNRKTPGSSPTSAHVNGLAMDFICPSFGTPLDICKAIAASPILFDQVIYEYRSWVHFAIVPPKLIGRLDLLTIDRDGKRMGLDAA